MKSLIRQGEGRITQLLLLFVPLRIRLNSRAASSVCPTAGRIANSIRPDDDLGQSPHSHSLVKWRGAGQLAGAHLKKTEERKTIIEE